MSHAHRGPGPLGFRAVAFVAAAVGALSLAGCCSSCNIPNPMDAQEKAEDERAKVQYYTDAAKTYYEGGKYEAAVRMWDKVIAVTPEDPWAKFGLAKALHMTGTVENLRRAERILLDILPYDWNHPTQGDVRFRIQTTLASVNTDLADYYDRDARVLDARLEREPSPEAAAQLRNEKQTQIGKRNVLLQRSIPLFEQVLVKSKEDPYALAGLAKAHLLLGSDEAGIGYAHRYLGLSQRNQVEWRRKLDEWPKMMGTKLSDEQRMFFVSKIQGAREKEKTMHLMLGSVHMRRDEFAAAVAEYDAVLAIDPASSAAYVERAQAYARLNQHRLAIRDLEEYLKLTDPVKHRAGRVNAAELLERYRRIADPSAAGLQPASAARAGYAAAPGFPAPAPGFPVPAGDEPPAAVGSPDGN
jgi:tetratricopeptide (TPR) repeat protein